MRNLQRRLNELEKLDILRGGHTTRENGMCVMEAVAWVAGEEHSDQPQCASRFITSILINRNDSLPSSEERNIWLKKLVPLLINTRTTDHDDTKRGYMVVDWTCREALAEVLGGDEAKKLRALEPITSPESAKKASLYLQKLASKTDKTGQQLDLICNAVKAAVALSVDGNPPLDPVTHASTILLRATENRESWTSLIERLCAVGRVEPCGFSGE